MKDAVIRVTWNIHHICDVKDTFEEASFFHVFVDMNAWYERCFDSCDMEHTA